MPYKKINWEYTEQEKLEIEQDKLSDARLKLSRWLNHHSRQFYTQEVEILEKSIKDRIHLLTFKDNAN